MRKVLTGAFICANLLAFSAWGYIAGWGFLGGMQMIFAFPLGLLFREHYWKYIEKIRKYILIAQEYIQPWARGLFELLFWILFFIAIDYSISKTGLSLFDYIYHSPFQVWIFGLGIWSNHHVKSWGVPSQSYNVIQEMSSWADERVEGGYCKECQTYDKLLKKYPFDPRIHKKGCYAVQTKMAVSSITLASYRELEGWDNEISDQDKA